MTPSPAHSTQNASQGRRFADFYRQPARPVISFEVFPPKTDQALIHLHNLLPDLIALEPSFMTVTYGALGTTRERTIDIARLIRSEYGKECACHLTCVGSSRADLDEILGEIRDSGIRNIVALRGDPPQGETTFTPPPDGYRYANELVAHIRGFETSRDANGTFGIAVAGYPEKHLESPDMAADLANLRRKVDAGADCVITQLFYDNEDFYRFERAARAAGISVPIIPGLLPIVSLKQIRRITSMCGSKIPTALLAELEEAGDDEARAGAIGIRQCIRQAQDLISHGVPGIHFYVLNRAAHMEQVMAAIR